MAKWKLHPHGAPPQTFIYKGFAGISWNVKAFFLKASHRRMSCAMGWVRSRMHLNQNAGF